MPFPKFRSSVPVQRHPGRFPRFTDGGIAALGACCASGGGCYMQEQADCLRFSGSVFHPACNCADNPDICTNRPCCFPTEDYRCESLSYDACLEAGGRPMERNDVRCCAEVNCVNDLPDYGACCLPNGDCVEGVSAVDCGDPEGLNGVWFRQTRCGDADCANPGAIGACCLGPEANYLCVEIGVVACLAQGGVFQGASTICAGEGAVDCLPPPMPDPDECREPMTNVPPEERLLWTEELCPLARMGLTIRDLQHYPQGVNATDWEAGFFELVSLHPIRAIEPDYRQTDEPCRYHFGGIVLGPDGFFVPAVLSQPLNNIADSIELSMGFAALQEDEDPDEVAERGMFHYAVTYHAPFWTEAHMHSAAARCLQPE